MKAEDLTLQEKIGQMFMVGMPGTEIDDITRKLITEYNQQKIDLFEASF